MSRLILSMFVLVMIPATSYAAQINEAGAQKLKSIFQTMLDYEKTITDSMGGIELVYDGELTVDMYEEYYTVTTPNFIIQEPGNTDPAQTFRIDAWKINAMPDEKEGLWKTTINIAPSYTFTDGDNSFQINIGKQNIVGILDESLNNFPKINMNLGEIEIKENGEVIEGFSLGDIQLYSNLDKAENGKFSGPGHLKITNIEIHDPSDFNDQTYKIGEFRFDMNFKDMKIPSLQEYQKKIEKHSETFKSLSSTDENAQEQLDPNALIDMFTDLYTFEMDGMSFSYNIENFQAIDNSDGEHKEFETVDLASATLGFGFDGLAQEKGTLNLKLGYDGFLVTPTDEFRSSTMPQNVNIDINALNIPYQSLIEMTQTTMAAIADNPETANMAGLGLMMRLPAILAQSETQIVVENNGLKNDTYNVDLNGKVITDLESMIGFSAQFKGIFKGLDTLTTIVENETKKTDPQDGHQWYELFTFLSTLQSIGVKEDGANGEPAYSFNFKTTPQGQMMVNGEDAATIFAK